MHCFNYNFKFCHSVFIFSSFFSFIEPFNNICQKHIIKYSNNKKRIQGVPSHTKMNIYLFTESENLFTKTRNFIWYNPKISRLEIKLRVGFRTWKEQILSLIFFFFQIPFRDNGSHPLLVCYYFTLDQLRMYHLSTIDPSQTKILCRSIFSFTFGVEMSRREFRVTLKNTKQIDLFWMASVISEWFIRSVEVLGSRSGKISQDVRKTLTNGLMPRYLFQGHPSCKSFITTHLSIKINRRMNKFFENRKKGPIDL